MSVHKEFVPGPVPVSRNHIKIAIKLSDNKVCHINHDTKNIKSNTGLCSQ